MKQITSLEEYKALIRENKAEHKLLDSNSFLMKKDVEEMIAAGVLYAEAYPSGIVFFSDEGDCYKVHYHIDRSMAFPEIRLDKPVVVDELDKAGKRSRYIKQAADRMKKAGFRYYRKNRQYEKGIEGTSAGINEMPEPFRMCFLKNDGRAQTGELMDQSVDLWEKNLELSDIDASHRTLEEGDCIICIVTPDNRVVATEWYRNRDGKSEGRHTVTDRAYRGRGFAKEMLLAWSDRAADAGMQKAFTWIAETNERSIRLHESVGFHETDTACIQYIKD